MSVRTNVDKVISISVMGEVAAPSMPGLPASPYAITSEGVPFLLPAWGSIVYNVSVGDSAYGWLADCIHPGVSVTLKVSATRRWWQQAMRGARRAWSRANRGASRNR
jgi:hypothetical protein